MSLLDDLAAAERLAAGQRTCPLCAALGAMEAGTAKDMLVRASAGTIGINTLVGILKRNSIVEPGSNRAIGRRTIQAHRVERHEP